MEVLCPRAFLSDIGHYMPSFRSQKLPRADNCHVLTYIFRILVQNSFLIFEKCLIGGILEFFNTLRSETFEVFNDF